MNRIAAIALAALVAAALRSDLARRSTDVTVYWEFDRNTLHRRRGRLRPLRHARELASRHRQPRLPRVGRRLRDRHRHDREPVSPATVPASTSRCRARLILGFQGTTTYVVTGWRNGVAARSPAARCTVNAVPRRRPYFGTAIAAGIPSDLTIDTILADAQRPRRVPDLRPRPRRPVPGLGRGRLRHARLAERHQLRPLLHAEHPVRAAWTATTSSSGSTPSTTRFAPPDIPWSICDFGFAHFRGQPLLATWIPLASARRLPRPPRGWSRFRRCLASASSTPASAASPSSAPSSTRCPGSTPSTSATRRACPTAPSRRRWSPSTRSATARVLVAHGVEMLVVACNTASAVALPALRAAFDVPVLGVVEPGRPRRGPGHPHRAGRRPRHPEHGGERRLPAGARRAHPRRRW